MEKRCCAASPPIFRGTASPSCSDARDRARDVYKRQTLINAAPKFGNDNDYADGFAREIFNYCADYVERPEHKDARGGQYCLSNLSETLHVTHGHNTLASADGRLAHTPLSDNASPSMGRDINGPTAAMNRCV